MPVERVYGRSFPYGEDDPGRAIVDIRWDSESEYMQLATLCVHAADHSVYIPEHVREALNKAGLAHTQELRTVGDDREVVYTCFDGFFVDLDRRGINKLIRNLRRARDQAFGRDE